jgi:hypothetical protein
VLVALQLPEPSEVLLDTEAVPAVTGDAWEALLDAPVTQGPKVSTTSACRQTPSHSRANYTAVPRSLAALPLE